LQLAKFEREPDLGVVISGYVDVEEDGQTEILAVKKSWERDALERMFNHEVFPPHAALIRRSVLEASPLFPENIDTNESQEDWQLWLDLALHGVQLSAIPELTCKYRNRPGSIRTNPLKHFDGARRVVNWLRGHPKAQIYAERVERLAAIVEMERVAVATRVNREDLAIENLVPAVRRFPTFWQDPATFVRLFECSLTLQESARWKQQRDLLWFEKRITGILQSADKRLSPNESRRLFAGFYLALSDLAYGSGDCSQRRRALGSAWRNSFVVCMSEQGRKSLVRAALGPQIGGQLRRLGSGAN